MVEKKLDDQIASIRRKVEKACSDSGFRPPEIGSADEEESIRALMNLDRSFLMCLMFLKMQLPQDNNLREPGHDSMNKTILDGDCNDQRLRCDKVVPSSLTPNEVARSLSCFIDEETGMPKIPVKPDLYPWEIVSHL